MARKTHRSGPAGHVASIRHPGSEEDIHPEDRRDPARRARIELTFDDQAVLGTLFGQFDANLVRI